MASAALAEIGIAPMEVEAAPLKAVATTPDDLYTRLKTLQKKLSFLNVQVWHFVHDDFWHFGCFCVWWFD